MTTAMERLEAALDAKDEEIQNLSEKLDESRRLLGAMRDGWRYDGPAPRDDIPVPRLELLYLPRPDWSDYRVLYRLVYRHLQGHLVAVPLGCTTIQGGDGDVETPYLPHYDGPHIAHDCGYLQFLAYRILPGREPELIDFDQYLLQVELGRAHRLEDSQ